MEISKEEARKILLDFGIEYSTKNNLSQLGGMKVLLELLKRGRFRDRFTELFGSYKARTLLQSVVGLWAGARTMVEIGQAGKDPLIKRFIGDVVEEAQLGRDYRAFSKQEIESLHDFNISQTIFDLVQKVPQDEVLYFDIDATAVEKYGHQEGVEKGYVGRQDPENCYQYLLVYFNNRKTFLYGTVRGGSAHSQNDFCGYLSRFLPMLERRWQTVFRGDSGYYNELAFDLMSEYSATFFIKAAMSESRHNLAQASSALTWGTVVDGASFASYTTVTAAGTKVREIYKRTITEVTQLSLGEMAGFRYDCVCTNDFTIDEAEAFNVYNKRAHIENAIKELKEDYQLGHIVTDNFDANDVITQITLFAYMIIQVFKNEVLPPKMQRMRLSTLRTQVFNVPACLVHWARRQICRMQNIFTPEVVMARIVKKALQLQSWAIDPPMPIFTAA